MENNEKQFKALVSTYHDYADAKEENAISTSKRKEKTFPVRLHCLLSEVERLGTDWIVGWSPHGRSFVVKDQSAFEHDILPSWSRQTKMASFQRQLNIYGFRRLSSGVDKGAYYHERFLRGKRFLAFSISRCSAQEAGRPGRRAVASDFGSEPNFYAMKHLPVSEAMRPSIDFDGLPIRETATASSNALSHAFLQPQEVTTALLRQNTHLASHLASNLAIDRTALGLSTPSLQAQTNSLVESILHPMQPAPSSSSPHLARLPLQYNLPTLLGSSIHPFGITQSRANEPLSLPRQWLPRDQYRSPLLQLLSSEQGTRYRERVSANLLNRPTFLSSPINPFAVTENQANEQLSFPRQWLPSDQYRSQLLQLLSSEQGTRYQEPVSANLLNRPTFLGSPINPFAVTENQANEQLSFPRQWLPSDQFRSPLLQLLLGRDSSEQGTRYQELAGANLPIFPAEGLREPKNNANTPASKPPR